MGPVPTYNGDPYHSRWRASHNKWASGSGRLKAASGSTGHALDESVNEML